ncbi:hypothetical protein GCM10010885_20200 [Alicyclobacillus cellulosilyticus]|uniref:ATP synthase protein I n=1 Tax=Alicyclobacillus cellulosilyticus TaxID=1003997 RepID=A0A917KE56_9BACL|nr:hypothetical protein [Alicyclobacillus cellulosilyticus]GGJ10929.1 hypothetical protein GCM10010885_20200 [Alicyclobacillus cellulosilyticus]
MTELERLKKRIRAIWLAGAVVFALTLLVWFVARPWHAVTSGLLLGEAGGAYVVYSLIRQGHLDDGMQGTALFASGMLGLFTRLVVLVAVLVVALKWKGVNPYAALAGYLLGFVLVFAGMYGIARNRGSIPEEK